VTKIPEEKYDLYQLTDCGSLAQCKEKFNTGLGKFFDNLRLNGVSMNIK